MTAIISIWTLWAVLPSTRWGMLIRRVVEAIAHQSARLIHVCNLYRVPEQELLGDKLCTLAGMDKVIFGNSGAEANEAALKIARLHAHKQQINNPAVVVMDGSFHGRTLATLSATGNRKIQAGFAPLVQGFIRTQFNDIEALQHIAQNSRNVVAVLLEPVQGEGGIVIPDEGYLQQVRDICDQHNWLMMLDEIQTGMGRTGRWFGWQHENTRPDVLTSAKALGNGVPIGACMASGAAAELITPGSHGSTFGGNPLACATAIAVIDSIEREDLVARTALLGTRILSGLREQLGGLAGIVEIRGKGLMLAIEMQQDCVELMQAGLDAGILLNVTAGNVVRLLPPYILTDEEADELVLRVSQVCKSYLAKL